MLEVPLVCCRNARAEENMSDGTEVMSPNYCLIKYNIFINDITKIIVHRDYCSCSPTFSKACIIIFFFFLSLSKMLNFGSVTVLISTSKVVAYSYSSSSVKKWHILTRFVAQTRFYHPLYIFKHPLHVEGTSVVHWVSSAFIFSSVG